MKAKIVSTGSGGNVSLKIEESDRAVLRPFLTKYLAKKKQMESKGRGVPLIEVTFKMYHKPRSLDQNALYWALVDILAWEIFQEHGHEDDVHEELLRIYAPRIEGPISKLAIPKRSKDMNVLEFCRLIEGTFKELAEHGVEMESAESIADYWHRWYEERFKAQGGDPLADDYSDDDEYRRRVVFCEACGRKLGEGEPGSMAHIVSKGAGGSNTAWNKLRLCDSCHVGAGEQVAQHLNGWEAFLAVYPHLRPKVEAAHNRSGEKEGKDGLK